MSKYELKFDPEALEEWNSLDGSIKAEFKKVLARRLESPFVASARLSGELSNCYKIKSKKTGYRLIYTLIDGQLVVVVIAIGKREKLKVYLEALKRNLKP